MKLSDLQPKPFSDFNTCWVCDTTYNDICMVELYREHDQTDQPTGKYVLICKEKSCQEVIEKHPLPYASTQWSAEGPGKFNLICGDCKHRDNFTCKHPDLTDNGGPGLEANFTPTPLTNARICFSNGKSIKLNPPATSCKGREG